MNGVRRRQAVRRGLAAAGLLLLAAGCSSLGRQDDFGSAEEAMAALRAGRLGGGDLQAEGGGAMGQGTAIRELEPIFFEFDDASVPAREMDKIRTVAQYLKRELKWFRVRLEGHADDRGSADYNFELGFRRSINVAALLVAYGIHPYRLHAVSYGEEFPAVRGIDSYSRSMNRRVEFVILIE